MAEGPKVVALAGAETGQEWALAVGVADLGRGEDCGIRLADGAASRRHAQLQWDGNALSLRDFGSTNRTYVNGHPVSEIDLASGDVIQIGQTQLRVTLPVVAQVVTAEDEEVAVPARRSTKGVRLTLVVGAAVVVVGGFAIFALRPQAPVSGRELAERDRAAAIESPWGASAARDARALSPAARQAFEEGRTMALYDRLPAAREALQRSLRIDSQNPSAAALLQEVEQRIDERIGVLIRRARAAISDREWIKARGALLEAADLANDGDPRVAEINQLRSELDARDIR